MTWWEQEDTLCGLTLAVHVRACLLQAPGFLHAGMMAHWLLIHKICTFFVNGMFQVAIDVSLSFHLQSFSEL